jgi:mRNA interferase MazF
MPYPTTEPRRGEVYYADLEPVVGSEQGGRRPILVISLDRDIPQLPTIVTAAITTTIRTRTNPLSPILPAGQPLREESAVLTFQIRTLDKSRLETFEGALTPLQMQLVNQGLAISFGLVNFVR